MLLVPNVVFTVVVIAASALNWYCGYMYCRKHWRDEMVKRGHARFHFFDGKWYWNEDVPKPSDPIAHRVRAQQEAADKAKEIKVA